MRAFRYLRISNDPEGLELGVTRQEEDTGKLAERLGADVVETFTDNDVSASTLSKKPRPEYARMLEAAQAGGCDAILAYSNSRLTRRPAEWEELLNLHAARKVEIHTVVSGSANFATADGRAVLRTIAAWDAAEAERLGERTRRALSALAEAGAPHGGSRPYGWEDDKVTPVLAEVQIIHEIAERVIGRESLHQIVRDLNARGIPAARGGKWQRSSVHNLLKSPRLIGVRRHKGALHPAQWPPVLDELKWHQVQAVLGEDGRSNGGNARVSLLARIARCGECGGLMNVKNGGDNARYYCAPCKLMRLRNVVDYYVERVVIHLLEQGFAPAEPPPPADLKRLNALKLKIAQTEEAFLEHDAQPPKEYVSTIRRLRAQLAAEERRLYPTPQGRIAGGVMGPDAEEAWNGLTLDLKRKVIVDLAEVRLHRALAGRRAFDPSTVEVNPCL